MELRHLHVDEVRAGLQSQYQEFIERTRYLRRGDYVFSDMLCAPLVLEELGVCDNMQIRMIRCKYA